MTKRKPEAKTALADEASPEASLPVPPSSDIEAIRQAIIDFTQRMDLIVRNVEGLRDALQNVPSKQAVEAFVKDTLAEYHARTQSAEAGGSKGLVGELFKGFLGLAKGGGLESSQADMERQVGHKMFTTWSNWVTKKWSKELGLPEHAGVQFSPHEEAKA